MKIAIIGSREGFTYGEVMPKLNKYYNSNNPKENCFITGGARGVDKIVELYAKELGIPIEIIRPINPSNKMDYLFRNVEIITKADKIIVFWNGYSKGTKFVIDYAKARNKELVVILSDKTSTLPNGNPNGEFNINLKTTPTDSSKFKKMLQRGVQLKCHTK